MQIRYNKLKEVLTAKKLDAILVSDGFNMRYFSGFTGGTGYLLITKNSKTLFTDSRYTIAATNQAPDYNVVEVDAARDYCKFINQVVEAENIAAELRKELETAFGEIPEEFFVYGEQTGESFVDGFMSKIEGFIGELEDFLTQADIEIKKADDSVTNQSVFSPSYNFYGDNALTSKIRMMAKNDALLAYMRGME